MTISDGDRIYPVRTSDGSVSALGPISSPSTAGDRFILQTTSDGFTVPVRVSKLDIDGDRGVAVRFSDGKIGIVKFGEVVYDFFMWGRNLYYEGGLPWPYQAYWNPVPLLPAEDYFIGADIAEMVFAKENSSAVLLKNGEFWVTGNEYPGAYPYKYTHFNTEAAGRFGGKAIKSLLPTTTHFVIDEDGALRRDNGQVVSEILDPDDVAMAYYNNRTTCFLKKDNVWSSVVFDQVYPIDRSNYTVNPQGNLLTGDSFEPASYGFPYQIYDYDQITGTIKKILTRAYGGGAQPTYILADNGDLFTCGINTNGEACVGYYSSETAYGTYDPRYSYEHGERPHHYWVNPTKILEGVIDVQEVASESPRVLALLSSGLVYDCTYITPVQVRGVFGVTSLKRQSLEDASGNRFLGATDRGSFYMFNRPMEYTFFEVAPFSQFIKETNGPQIIMDGYSETYIPVYMIWAYYCSPQTGVWQLDYVGSSYDEITEWTQYGSHWYITTKAGQMTTGEGLDDIFVYPAMSFFGVDTEDSSEVIIRIMSVGDPELGTKDKFNMSNDGGATWLCGGNPDITDDLSYGLSYTAAGDLDGYYTGFTFGFHSTTGHSVGDTWTVSTRPSIPSVAETIYYYWESRYIIICSETDPDPGWFTPVLRATHGEGPARGWGAGLNGNNTCVTTSATVPSPPTGTIPQIYHYYATWKCSTLEWIKEVSYVTFFGYSKDFSILLNNITPWSPYEDGPTTWTIPYPYDITANNNYLYGMSVPCTGSPYTRPASNPPDQPTWWVWKATWRSWTSSWIVTDEGCTIQTQAVENSWVGDCTPQYQYTTTDVQPSAPSGTPNWAIWEWQGVYNCTTSAWDVIPLHTHSPSGALCEGTATDWIECWGLWTKATTTSTAPSPPTETPLCYYSWEATCSSGTWTKTLISVDSYGYDTGGWICPGFCYLTTTIPGTPADPSKPCV